MSASFRALGTTVTVAAADAARVGDARAVVERELAAVDRACSRFRDDSELTLLVRARGRSTPVSPLLFSALRAALDASQATGGLLDPTVGRTLRLAGYDATFGVVLRRDGARFRAAFEPAPGPQAIELDEIARTARLDDGVELDLGATAKALAADRAAAAAAAAAGCGVLVSLGGDVSVAGPAPAAGWPIGIADDHAAADVATTVAIVTGGLATSSTAVRRWRSGTRMLHHLVDPRTGRPATTRWRTVSVAAATCLDANVAATAAVLLGDDAPRWLGARGLPARLAAADGTVVTTAGWPADRAAAA